MEQTPEITIELILQNSFSVKDPEDIKKLNLQSQSFPKINTTINEYCPKIQKLNLSYNNIDTLENLNQLQELTELNMHHNKISSTKLLNSNTQLQILNLSHNCISSMKIIPNLPKLQSLRLDNNQLKSLQGMESYRELKDLSLSNNYLKSISFLPPLPKIQELKIANNNIESLSVKLFENLENLLILDISENKIKNLDFLSPLQENLEKLNVKQNKIDYIPTDLRFENVDQVDFSHNQISVVQDFDLIFPALINLDLSYNEILLTEDLEVLEYMNLIVEVNFKGNLCSKKEEPFIEELKKKYPLIQVINGFQVHDPGFRYQEMMRELEEDMDHKKEKRGEEYDQGDENFQKIVNQYSKQIETIKNAGEELDIIRKNLTLQQIHDQYTNTQNKNLQAFQDETEYKSFMDEYTSEMRKIKKRYEIIVDFSKEQKRKLRSHSLDNINENFYGEQEQEDDNDEAENELNDKLYNENQDFEQQDMDQEYLENLEKENIQSCQTEFNNQEQEEIQGGEDDKIFNELMQDPQKREEFNKIQKQLKKQILSPSDLTYMSKNPQKTHNSHKYPNKNSLNHTLNSTSSLLESKKQGHLKKFQLNNEKIKKTLQSDPLKSNMMKRQSQQSSIMDEIKSVKNQMADPQFMKTIGSSNEYGNLGVLHEGLMGSVTLKPKLPFAPKKSLEGTMKFRQTDMGNYGGATGGGGVRGNSAKKSTRPTAKKGNFVATPRGKRSNSNYDEKALDSTNHSSVKSQKEKINLQEQQLMAGSSSKIKTKLLTAINYKK